ncbi:hypothetical protein [uncultured Clostridium sp.]|jgi:hypothetical protein|uniref:hypothetical protein n=1 Tax=uncultured Clostridium sp. TaxID=59620 RepID=UPI00260AE244|nr:hypothetical protein [uncultured Clostridium sp.]MCI9110601.1 hypothetical protein [Bacilli bacterium]
MKIEFELRPCKANGKKALFHTWSNKSQIVQPSMLRGGENGGVLKYTVGIVEFENGKVGECLLNEIQFLDNKLDDYCFNGYEELNKTQIENIIWSIENNRQVSGDTKVLDDVLKALKNIKSN